MVSSKGGNANTAGALPSQVLWIGLINMEASLQSQFLSSSTRTQQCHIFNLVENPGWGGRGGVLGEILSGYVLQPRRAPTPL